MKSILRDLLMDFVDWCCSKANQLEPKNVSQLNRLINMYPLIKNSPWWPEPGHRMTGERRAAVEKVVGAWIEINRPAAARLAFKDET